MDTDDQYQGYFDESRKDSDGWSGWWKAVGVERRWRGLEGDGKVKRTLPDARTTSFLATILKGIFLFKKQALL